MGAFWERPDRFVDTCLAGAELIMVWTTKNRNAAVLRSCTGLVILSVLAVRTAAAPAAEKLVDDTESARAQRAARLVDHEGAGRAI